MAYNSEIILTTIVTYYSQNYAGILGTSLQHTQLLNLAIHTLKSRKAVLLKF